MWDMEVELVGRAREQGVKVRDGGLARHWISLTTVSHWLKSERRCRD
jgi:hypothetical protein